MKRFSKGRLIATLRQRAEIIQKEQRFDVRFGWSQVIPCPSDEALCKLIRRAVLYGQSSEAERIATAVEHGELGT